MKKSKIVNIRIVSTISALALAAGCGSKPTHQKVCGDNNGKTVPVEQCEQEAKRYQEAQRSGTHSGFMPLYHWFYAPYGHPTPQIGAPLHGFTRSTPTGNGVRLSTPSSVRGGFGSSGSSVGG